jgi:Cytochrome P460
MKILIVRWRGFWLPRLVASTLLGKKSILEGAHFMKRVVCLLTALLTLTGAVVYMAHATGRVHEAAPIFGIKLPAGYRDWKLISVAHEAGNLNDLRAVLGNDVAIQAYREEKLPFPDGTIIARLAWSYVPSEENNKVFGRSQSFVAGAPTNVQFIVKDSKKYAATGGWGFAQFNDGKPADEALLKTCFPCHEPVKARDFVFTRYSR